MNTPTSAKLSPIAQPKTLTPRPITLLLILVALLFALPATGTAAVFIKIGDIKGESKDDGHKDEIDVLAWSWGTSCPADTTIGGGGGAGKVDVQDLSFTKYLDKASPKLFESCVSGTSHPDATLVMRRAGDRPLEYLIIRMEDVLVTSVSTGGSGGEDRLTENVTLNFKKIEMIYTEQTPDGVPGEQVTFAWDFGANTEG